MVSVQASMKEVDLIDCKQQMMKRMRIPNVDLMTSTSMKSRREREWEERGKDVCCLWRSCVMDYRPFDLFV